MIHQYNHSVGLWDGPHRGFALLLTVLTLISSFTIAVAQPVVRGDVPASPSVHNAARSRTAALAEDINRIINHRNFADATWGVSVVGCDNGEVLFEERGGANRQYASNIKLLTTSAALIRFGEDSRFSTELYLAVDSTTRRGKGIDLVIRPFGDPSLSPSFGIDPREVIRQWGTLLDSLGVRSIENVIVDAGYFDAVPYALGWAWDDESFGFNAQISAAAIYDNSIEVRVTPGAKTGDPVKIDVVPATAYVSLQVTASTSRNDSTSSLDIRRERGSDVIIISGRIAAGSDTYVEHISVEDPPEYYGTIVSEELSRQGIEVHGGVFDAREFRTPIPYSSLRRIFVYRSPRLATIVAAVNKQSLNLAAEMIAKRLGREFQEGGSTAAGVDVIRTFLMEVGVDVEHLRIVDGSGLSRQNMLSPTDMTSLLRWMWRSKVSSSFSGSLSVAGVDGTLSARMKGSLAEGNAFGKTGYLNGIRALSGYVRTRDGEWLAYSLVVNNYSVPTSVVNTAQDLIIMRLASFSRRS
jgi:D-alanyl-D-alanine carboxypeptidase/D-alanyl-D-alanine-endopeptidase (penicillin-binding protein 4)